MEFYKKPSRVKRSKDHFCSRKCSDKFKKGKAPTNIKIVPKENIIITQPKILYFDIETTNLGADFGEMLMYAYCWHNEPENVKVVSVLDYEKSFELPIEQRDKYLLPGLINLINEADEVVAHYGCVDPEHKILMADMSYKKAGDVQVGDKIITIQESPEKAYSRRKFIKTEVTFSQIIKKPKLQITLSDGTVLKCSQDHPFLFPKGKANGANWTWRKAEDFKIGDYLTRIVPEWETDLSYDAGYLAAALDGEGYIRATKGLRMGFAQKDNVMLSEFNRIALIKGVKTNQYTHDTPVNRIQIDGIFNVFKCLGSIKPKRLLDNFINNLNTCMHVPNNNTRTYIIDIKKIGIGDVMGLSTKEGTYISDGFASHNSKFDCRFVQTRAIINDIPIADIRWSKIFDTCITARKQLKFQSNRLANIAEALGLDVRKSHLDKKIWRRANAYDIDAIIEMIDYCKQDVIVLYQIAQKIRPVTKHLTSMKILTDSEKMICYCCGSENLISKDFYLTKTNKYTRYQCNNCGAWQRSSKPLKNTSERTMY
jgi:hypothetical protein